MINKSEAAPRTPIAILGSGSIAQKAYFPLLTAWEGIEIAAIYSRNAQHAMNACARWNLPYWSTSIDDLFKLNIKAAFVLTSKESHYSLIQTLLEDGVDVFVEKPLTTTSQQALELAELAQKKKRILMVGFNRRYALLYRQAKQKLDGKEIQLIVIQKHRTTPHYPNLTEFYLEDYIHQIDLLRYFCGEVEPLQTSFQMRDQTLHSCISTVLLPNGGLGTLLSAHTAGIWQESVSIHADNLSIHVDAFRNLWVRYAEHEELFGSDRAGNWTPDLRERGFIPEIEHFFHCIETRAEPESNGLEAAKTQQLLEKLLPGS
ncbi:MAG TPA: Gfo/Idh/MocA family oxidoreductase [Anaerolineaceae bacterium]|nr:Gfo/Idh/MocA family oxidoreductase [Anaerolineaceae bacterium]